MGPGCIRTDVIALDHIAGRGSATEPDAQVVSRNDVPGVGRRPANQVIGRIGNINARAEVVVGPDGGAGRVRTDKISGNGISTATGQFDGAGKRASVEVI